MKTCVECATELYDEAKYCRRCGLNQSEGRVKKGKEKPKTTKKAAPKTQEKKSVAPKKSTAARKKKEGLTFQERKQAIYEMTPQDNCGECGCKNCMAFAMKAASLNSDMQLTDCSHIEHDEAVRFCNDVEWL